MTREGNGMMMERIKELANLTRARARRAVKGHFTVGPITIYGDNAMHFALNVRTRLGYLCARPTTGDGHWPWYLYLSPNATPWAATFAIGPGVSTDDAVRALRRQRRFGHGYEWEHLPSGAIRAAGGDFREWQRFLDLRESNRNASAAA